jgi:3-deoxy-D-manno-octulosonate 8-phosphate phosphatase (KDO 8-P phosphatase)
VIATLAPSIIASIRAIRLVVFDFDGVMTDNFVYVDENGIESVRCWRGDGIGLRALERLGISTAVVSTEINPVVSARARKLGITSIQGCTNKLAEIDALCGRLALTRNQVAFVGNDINDAECLTSVGFAVVVEDAHEDVLPLAMYRTRARGGRGAVREVCDLIARVVESGVVSV